MSYIPGTSLILAVGPTTTRSYEVQDTTAAHNSLSAVFNTNPNP
jgi:hypothetical protein